MSYAACKAETNMPANTLISELFAAPYRFEFAQALALLEKCYPRKTPLGTGLDPRQETVRLSGPLYPLFYPSALASLSKTSPRLCFRASTKTFKLSLRSKPVKRRSHASQLELQACHFGLGGPDGPLPYAYQEWLQGRRLQKDHAPAAFLDLFHQRILGQLYRVQGKHHIAAPFTAPDRSAVQPLLRALAGILPKPLHNRQQISDQALLARVPILANRRRSVEGFKALVASYWGDALTIRQFDGAWSNLPASHLSLLGAKNNTLGQNAVAGKRIWDEHAGITLTIGPLSLDKYLAYLPTGKLYGKLMALAAFYFGPEMRCRLVLKLAPDARTASDGPHSTPLSKTATPFLLGQTTWLGESKNLPRQCQISPGSAAL
jgi:type VI secretion system protein ImpH